MLVLSSPGPSLASGVGALPAHLWPDVEVAALDHPGEDLDGPQRGVAQPVLPEERLHGLAAHV